MAEAADRDLWVVSSDEDDEEIRQVFGAREKTPMPNSDDSESDWSQPKTARPLQEAPLPKETLPPSDRRGTGPPAASLDGIRVVVPTRKSTFIPRWGLWEGFVTSL